jgi:uncharacterized protein
LKVAVAVYTPGQAYFWGSIISLLLKDGHQVLVLARESGLIKKILSQYTVQYVTFGKSKRANYSKLLQLPGQFITSFKCLNRFRPDIITGASILESNTAAILGKPCIIFEDTEITPALERLQWQLTASCIVTPSCFKLNLGKKQVRINGYKELAYLHPNYFKPDPAIFGELKIQPEEKYAVVRFNSFSAVHDVKLHGLSIDDKYKIVSELRKYVKVFIAAEGELPEDLAKHRIPIQPHRIHHALHYAQIVMGDSGTITSEAAVLGTPSIRCNSGLGLKELGNFIELENTYDLIYCAQHLEDILPKALALISNPRLKEEWGIKCRKLLSEKIDVAKFMVDLIENYSGTGKKLPHN